MGKVRARVCISWKNWASANGMGSTTLVWAEKAVVYKVASPMEVQCSV